MRESLEPYSLSLHSQPAASWLSMAHCCCYPHRHWNRHIGGSWGTPAFTTPLEWLCDPLGVWDPHFEDCSRHCHNPYKRANNGLSLTRPRGVPSNTYP